MEFTNKFYIPVYILSAETEHEPWHQLYAVLGDYDHVTAKWVTDEDGQVVCGDTLSPLLDQESYDGMCIRKPLVLDHFTADPDELQRLAENLIL